MTAYTSESSKERWIMTRRNLMMYLVKDLKLDRCSMQSNDSHAVASLEDLTRMVYPS
jgi:hypothetical protein